MMLPDLSLLSHLTKPTDMLPIIPHRQNAINPSLRSYQEGNSQSGFVRDTANDRFRKMYEENEPIALIAKNASALLKWHKTLRDAVHEGALPVEQMQKLVNNDGRLRTPLAKATFKDNYLDMYTAITTNGRELIAAERRGEAVTADEMR